MKKACKFEDSLLAQMGWTREDYEDLTYKICNLKMGNNLKLTPQETRNYIDCAEAIALRDVRREPTYMELLEFWNLYHGKEYH